MSTINFYSILNSISWLRKLYFWGFFGIFIYLFREGGSGVRGMKIQFFDSIKFWISFKFIFEFSNFLDRNRYQESLMIFKNYASFQTKVWIFFVIKSEIIFPKITKKIQGNIISFTERIRIKFVSVGYLHNNLSILLPNSENRHFPCNKFSPPHKLWTALHINISTKKYLLEKYSLIKWFFNFLFHFTFFMNDYFLQTLIFIMNFILFCGIFMEIFEFSIQLEVCEENRYEPHDKMLQNYEFMRKFG